MLNTNMVGTVFLDNGTPDNTNVATLSRPGELGVRFKYGANVYQRVLLYSGASPTPAANQLLFWYTRSTFIVTNKLADSKRNQVCGILRCAATAGYYIDMLIAGPGINVKSFDNSPVAGDLLIASSTAAADGVTMVAGTAPTYKVIGAVTASASANVAVVDVDLSVD